MPLLNIHWGMLILLQSIDKESVFLLQKWTFLKGKCHKCNFTMWLSGSFVSKPCCFLSYTTRGTLMVVSSSESSMALPVLEQPPDFSGRLQPQDYGEVPWDRATGQTSKTPKPFCNPIMEFICVMFWPKAAFSTSEIWVFLVGTGLHSKSQLISHPVKYLYT